jgi:hypothetical protein
VRSMKALINVMPLGGGTESFDLVMFAGIVKQGSVVLSYPAQNGMKQNRQCLFRQAGM